MANPLFSVIIPAYNEELYITTVLTSLAHQSFKDFEVILVDATSSDKTVSLSKPFASDFPLKIVSTPIRNLAGSRNIGATHAKGTYLFFIDADNDIHSDFFKKSEEYLMANPVDVVIPRTTPSNNRSIDKFLHWIGFFYVKCFLVTPRPFSTGGNIIVKRDSFIKTSGFDTHVFVGEDHDIIRRLRDVHAKIALTSDLVVIYSTRRFEQQGFGTYIKYLYSGIYLIFFRRIKKHIYPYEMGGQNFAKKNA